MIYHIITESSEASDYKRKENTHMNTTPKKIYKDYILKARRRRFIQYTICFIVIALFVVPLAMSMCYDIYERESVDGKVVSMTEEFFTVEYYAGGYTVSQHKTFAKSDMILPVKVGDTVIVYSDKPLRQNEDIRVDNLMPVVRILFLLPAVYYFIKALYFMYLKSKNLKVLQTLHTEGKLLSCDIERIENKSRLFRNYKIHLTYTDDYGKEHRFETERFYFNPIPYLEGVKKLNVFVDPDNYSLYDITFPDNFPSDTWHYYY